MEENKKLEETLDKSNEKLHISDIISGKTPNWDDIFRECGMLDEHTEEYYIGCMNYIKEKYHPPKIK
jgi:hypothetical protein